MAESQIVNSKKAFGYEPGEGANQQHNEISVQVFRNMSTVVIPAFSPVCLSSLAPDGTGVVASTVIGSAKFVGVAQEAMSSVASTAITATSLAAQGTWGRVCVYGPTIAAVSTGAAIGDVLTNGNSTLGGGNALQTYTTLVPAVAGALSGAAGFALTSATTGTTGFLSTVQPRAMVYLRPSFAFATTA